MSGIKAKASGKFVIRIPPEWHAHLRTLAQRQSTSLNEVIKSKLDPSRKGPADDFVLFEIFGPGFIGVIQFGSTVKAQATHESDIDWLIVFNSSYPISRDLYSKWDQSLAKNFDSKVSPQFATLPIDLKSISSLWLEAALEGHILSDSTGELQLVQYRIRDLIASGYYRRSYTHGHPYWVREDRFAK